MQNILCKAKLNKAKVTSCNKDYSGSIAVDNRVLKALGIFPYEKVLVVNRDKGDRFETYVVPGEEGKCELQGGAALKGDLGDTIAVLAFTIVDESKAKGWKPKIVELSENGKIIHIEAKDYEFA